MSVISSDPLKSKKSIPDSNIKDLCIDGGFTKISESVQSAADFPHDCLSATIAVHLTPDGRCGQSEIIAFGGPLSVNIQAKKLWPTADDKRELIITIEDLNQVKWIRNFMYTNWMDSKDPKISFKWIDHDTSLPREDADDLDEEEAEGEIACTGWSVRLNMRPKSSTELRLDTLIVPVALSAFTEQTYPNNSDLRYPSFKTANHSQDTVKLLRCEVGPETYGIGVFPWLVDMRTAPGPLPESYDVKLAVSSLLRAAQDPQFKLKFDTWNSVAKSHIPSSKKASTMWPKPLRETPLPAAGTGGITNSSKSTVYKQNTIYILNQNPHILCSYKPISNNQSILVFF